jgi:hypothetical protein
VRYGAKQGGATDYQLARTGAWPTWGYGSNPDLSMGSIGPPGSAGAGCRIGARGGGSFDPVVGNGSRPVPPPICGSISLGTWGATQLEVWRICDPRKKNDC